MIEKDEVERTATECERRYVVGADRLLRSQSRLWIEDPDEFLDEIDDDSLRGLVQAFNSPVGLQPVDTEPVRAAFEGRTPPRLHQVS